VWINSNESPDERDENQEYVDRCEKIVLEAKLKIGKRKIENEVDHKWQCDYCRKFFCVDFVKYSTVGNGNYSVKYCPNRSKEPAGWCP